jgi:lipoyl(octanoyl) transferase
VDATAQTQLVIEHRGRERYADTWQRQLELHAQRAAGEIGDTLILVEHEHVVTLGRHGESGNLVASEALLAQQGVDLHRIERGGDITYHGPGQLVGYPIVSLRARGLSVHQYVTALEQALIDMAAAFGIAARRSPGFNGVWVDSTDTAAEGGATERKLAAIGVAIRKGVSYHGFALNVSTDLSKFELIVPCGIVGRGVTSLSRELGREIPMDEVTPGLISALNSAL